MKMLMSILLLLWMSILMMWMWRVRGGGRLGMISIPKMEIIGRIMKPVRRSDLLLMSDMWMMMTDTRMDIVMTMMVMVSFPRMEIIGWVMKPVRSTSCC